MCIRDSLNGGQRRGGVKLVEAETVGAVADPGRQIVQPRVESGNKLLSHGKDDPAPGILQQFADRGKEFRLDGIVGRVEGEDLLKLIKNEYFFALAGRQAARPASRNPAWSRAIFFICRGIRLVLK